MAQQEVQRGGAVKFTAVKPQLMVEAPKAVDAVEFYKTAFGAVEVGHTVYPKREAEKEASHILCVQLELAGSTFNVFDIDDSPAPVKTEAIGCELCLVTEDVEAAIAKAVSAGAVAEGEITEGKGVCCGARVGKLKDPFGYVWLICDPSKKCC